MPEKQQQAEMRGLAQKGYANRMLVEYRALINRYPEGARLREAGRQRLLEDVATVIPKGRYIDIEGNFAEVRSFECREHARAKDCVIVYFDERARKEWRLPVEFFFEIHGFAYIDAAS